MKLEIEITDKMKAKLQERADRFAVEPADIAKMILASELAKEGKPCWFDKLHSLVERVTEAVIAASKLETKE